MRSASIPTASRIEALAGASSRSRRLILAVSGGVLIFAPLAYGGVHPWAYYSIGLLVTFLSLTLLVVGFYEIAAKPRTRIWPYPPLWWLGAGLILLVSIQVFPWPQGLVKWLSPHAWEIRALGNGFGLQEMIPFSLNPYGTMVESLKLWPGLALFFILIYTINTRRQIQAMVGLILAVALFEVFYGFWHFRSHLIWGWRNPYPGNRLCGTFINSNHLATFLTMAILLGYGWFLALRKEIPLIATNSSGWDRLRRLSRSESLEPQFRRFLLLFLLLLLAVGLIFTGSRGGMVSLVMGFVLMALLNLGQRWKKGHIFIMVGFMAAALLYSLFLGSNAVLARFQDVTDQVRYQAFKASLAIFREYPLIGSGLSTFGDLFYRYEPAELRGSYFIYAHSDWLQLLAETGVVGFSLVAGAWLVFFGKLTQEWRQSRNVFARGLGLGGIAALGAGVFHALVEFPFHIPACGLLFTGIAAITYLAVSSHRQGVEYFSYRIIKTSSNHRKVACLAMLGLIAVQLAIGLRVCYNLLAEAAAPTEINSTRTPPKLEVKDFQRALAFNPNNSKYYWGLAEALEKQKAGEKIREDKVEKCLKSAVFLSPAHWGYRLKLAEFYLRHYKGTPSHIPLALQELAAAVKFFPESALLNFRFASVLGWADIFYPELVPPNLRGCRANYLKKAVRLEPKLSKYLKH